MCPVAYCRATESLSIPPLRSQSLTLWTQDTAAAALAAACSPASEPLTRNMTSLSAAPSNPDASDAATATNAARVAMEFLLNEQILLGTGREPPSPQSVGALRRFQALRSSLQACTPSLPQAEGGSSGSLSLGLPPVRMGLVGGLSGAWLLEGVWSLLPGTVFSATVQLLDHFGQPVTTG